jgi:hypothetical protein
MNISCPVGSIDSTSRLHSCNPLLKLCKTYGFAIAIIIGIGGLAVGGVGVAGYFGGAISNLNQVHAIIMMAAGGGGGFLLLAIGAVKSVRSYRQYVEDNQNLQDVEDLEISQSDDVTNYYAAVPSVKEDMIETFFKMLEEFHQVDTNHSAKTHEEWKSKKDVVSTVCLQLHQIFHNAYKEDQPLNIEMSDLVKQFGTTESKLKKLFKMYRFPTVSYTNGACLNSFFYHLYRHHKEHGARIVGIGVLQRNGNPLWPENKKITTLDEFAQFTFSTPENCKKVLNIKDNDFDPNKVEDYLCTLSFGSKTKDIQEGMNTTVLSFSDFTKPWTDQHKWSLDAVKM